MSDVLEQPAVGGAQAIRLQLAGLLASQGNLGEAVENYQELIAEAPDLAEARAQLGIVLAAQGENSAARDCLEAALALAPGATEVRLNLAQILLALGELEGAMAHYRQVLARAPENLEALIGLGATLHQAGAAGAARPLLETALRLAPDDIRANAALGQLHLDGEDYDRAIACYEIAARGSEAPIIGFNLATALLRGGDWIGARRRAEVLLEGHGDFALGWHILGQALAKGGHAGRAISAFEKALQLAPDLLAPRYGLAQCMKRVGDHGAAIGHYQALLPQFSKSHEFLREYAHTLERLGRDEEALEMVLKALEVAPDDALSWSLLAVIQANLSRHEAALEAADKAIQLAPDEPAATVIKARSLQELGRYEAAVACLSSILELIADDAEL